MLQNNESFNDQLTNAQLLSYHFNNLLWIDEFSTKRYEILKHLIMNNVS